MGFENSNFDIDNYCLLCWYEITVVRSVRKRLKQTFYLQVLSWSSPLPCWLQGSTFTTYGKYLLRKTIMIVLILKLGIKEVPITEVNCSCISLFLCVSISEKKNSIPSSLHIYPHPLWCSGLVAVNYEVHPLGRIYFLCKLVFISNVHKTKRK